MVEEGEQNVGTKPNDTMKVSYKETLAPTNMKKNVVEGTHNGEDSEEEEVDLDEVLRRVKVVHTPRGPDFYPSEKERSRLRKPFNLTLIVKLLGRPVGYGYLAKKLLELWGRKGEVEVVDISCGFYTVRFNHQDDYENALMGGPWMILDHILVVKKWQPNFDPRKEKIDSIAAWVRMPLMPGEYYDKYFLYVIGKEIGRVLKVDHMTLKKTRGKYARVCVELDLTKPLQPCYFIEGVEYKLEYEGIHNICFHCGKVGHSMEFCEELKKLKAGQAEQGTDRNGGQRATPSETTVYGEWMTVRPQRRGKRVDVTDANPNNPRRGLGGNIGGNLGGSRFELLRDFSDMQGDKIDSNAQPRVPLKDVTNEARMRPIIREGPTRVVKPNTRSEKQESRKEKTHESPMKILERAKERIFDDGPNSAFLVTSNGMELDIEQSQRNSEEYESLGTVVPNTTEDVQGETIQGKPPDIDLIDASSKLGPDAEDGALEKSCTVQTMQE